MSITHFSDLEEIKEFFYADVDTFNEFDNAYLKELKMAHQKNIEKSTNQLQLIEKAENHLGVI